MGVEWVEGVDVQTRRKQQKQQKKKAPSTYHTTMQIIHQLTYGIGGFVSTTAYV
jgi:hypothetical protein